MTKEKTPSQNDLILNHLMEHPNGITPAEAYELYGCMRLSARISDLRKDLYEIETIQVTKKNRYGHTTNFARYRLRERNKVNG